MAVSKRQKREATIAAIKEEILKTVPKERPDLEQAHKSYASIRTARSAESIQASRMVEINKWRERGVEKRWSRAEAVASGGKIFPARWADDQHKEKSRYVVKEFANTRDPTMFAAASDTAVGRVVEYKAVLQNCSMFTFDVTSAYTPGRTNSSLWNRHRRRSRSMVIVCGGRWESFTGVARVRGLGRGTSTPSSGARKHIRSVQLSAMSGTQMA